jgi:hypothetical protein
MITLKKLYGPASDSSYRHVWPLRIEAASSEPNVSSKIFVYARNASPAKGDVYLDVADVVEMELVPADKPNDKSVLFRTNIAEFSCRTAELRDDICAELDTAVAQLNADWEAFRERGADVYTGSIYRLTKKIMQGQVAAEATAWPVTIVAEAIDPSYDPAIFVYHASCGDDSYEGDVFECVASVQQLAELPKDAATKEADLLIPYYRTVTMTHNTTSPEAALELWEAIKEDVEDLEGNWLTVVDTDAYVEV